MARFVLKKNSVIFTFDSSCSYASQRSVRVYSCFVDSFRHHIRIMQNERKQLATLQKLRRSVCVNLNHNNS